MEDTFPRVGMSSFENEEYSSRSYIEMPQTGEVNYISTIIGVRGNPIYKGKGIWIAKPEKTSFTTVKVDKDDIRAKRHYVKTLFKDGREVKIWECGLCGKEFRFQYTLVRHIPTHTDVRNYQCDICPKAFRQLSTLAQHKATHLNMRPFLCDFCKKSFNRISTLISHKKIHYDEKRHICPFCGKGFHQKGNLRNHMYTHTNERPYKCEVCNKGFNQKSNLVCHKISTHSKKILYQCEICNLSFAKQNLYISHMESAHNIIVKFSRRSPSSESTPSSNIKETQCTLVDESNNVIYHLPISQEIKNPSMPPKTDIPTNAINQFQENNQENEILTIIKHNATEAMNQLNEIGQVPFVLFYQAGESQPKICKAIVNNNEYALVHPSNSDISKYFIQNANNSLSHKFPIVSTVIQKKDSTGKVQTLVLPAGLNPQVVESFEGANGANVFDYYQALNFAKPDLINEVKKEIDFEVYDNVAQNKNGRTAVVFTKTQPSVRQARGRILFESIGSKANLAQPENAMAPEVVPPLDAYNNNSENPIEFLYIPGESTRPEKEDLFEKANWPENKVEPIIFLPNQELNTKKDFNLVNHDEQSSCTVLNSFGMAPLNSQEDKPVSVEVEIQNEQQVTSIKSEIETQENQDTCSDIEPTLFSNLEALKEPFSKYNIDFDGDTFDLFEDCSFADGLLDTVNNTTEENKCFNSLITDADLSIKQEPNMYFNQM
ncbi:zinc finger protein 281-like [Cimex lectularius]|uniref:C2H2-type domain-containing protein n=1 Tax=Cimex lectularius TaxID=79782 RepID=A0A8I6TH94_CIMLE|nr:zinc finger protein 281-like [Cimex lectularius]XP_014259749.1 zinc finger protein 281-like [Cimex lectularius]XP_014259751.1 zinc finger protein 281-like [Cimex lectularius]XP_014259752.1 zinc finger protein 281-like [Cimex lectularius]XP_014259753.1 zinc finger protein 281-like [Cimex lectularius]